MGNNLANQENIDDDEIAVIGEVIQNPPANRPNEIEILEDDVQVVRVVNPQQRQPEMEPGVEILGVVNRRRSPQSAEIPEQSIVIVDECDADGNPVCISQKTRRGQKTGDDPQELKQRIEKAMNKLKELFPDLDLKAFLQKEATKRKKCKSLMCSCTNEETIVNTLSDYILANAHEFKQIQHNTQEPVSKKSKKKNTDTNLDKTIYEPAAELPYNALSPENLSNFFKSINSEFVKILHDDGNYFEGHNPSIEHCECYKWLQKKFTKLRCYVFTKLDHALRAVIGHNPLALAIACFLIENEIIEKEEFGDLRAAFISDKYEINWEDMQNFLIHRSLETRIKKFEKYVPLYAEGIQQKYMEFMQKLRTNYSEYFDVNEKLNKNLLFNPTMNGEEGPVFQCLVCFEEFLQKYGVSCENMGTNVPNPNKPSSSKEQQTLPIHTFCRPCMRGHAKAATGEMPLAEGGIGLRCMMDRCKNPILLYDIKDYLPRDVRDRLNERIVEENLGMAQIEHLERCKRCNFAIDMEVPPEINKVFNCLQCNYQFCRLCGEQWDNKHFGYSCDETKGNEKAQKDLEVKLNELVMRKCPRCGVQFVKSEACNKMTCRCGLTMCYVCRETNIDYSHFCQCVRDPRQKRPLDCRCGKTCLVWENAERNDREALRELMNKAPEPLRFNLNLKK